MFVSSIDTNLACIDTRSFDWPLFSLSIDTTLGSIDTRYKFGKSNCVGIDTRFSCIDTSSSWMFPLCASIDTPIGSIDTPWLLLRFCPVLGIPLSLDLLFSISPFILEHTMLKNHFLHVLVSIHKSPIFDVSGYMKKGMENYFKLVERIGWEYNPARRIF